MYVDNKRALKIIAIVIIFLTLIVICIGKVAMGVKVTPKNEQLTNEITKEIDIITRHDSSEYEIKKTNVIHENNLNSNSMINTEIDE